MVACHVRRLRTNKSRRARYWMTKLCFTSISIDKYHRSWVIGHWVIGHRVKVMGYRS